MKTTEAADFILDALAAYRLTRLVTEDSITAPLRERIALHPHPAATPLTELVTCPYCTSVHAAFLIGTLRVLAPDNKLTRLFIRALALSGAVCLYYERRDGQ